MHTIDPMNSALDIARFAHGKQRDRNGEPYVFHCLRVMHDQVTDRARVLAILHDTLEDAEDSETVAKMIVQTLGMDYLNAVLTLTHQDVYTYEEYVQEIANSGDADCMRVKLADIRDNSRIDRMDDRAEKKIPLYRAAYARLSRALEEITTSTIEGNREEALTAR